MSHRFFNISKRSNHEFIVKLSEKTRIFEELVEGEKPSHPTKNMVEDRQPKVFKFPIRETNGEYE